MKIHIQFTQNQILPDKLQNEISTFNTIII